MTETGIDTATVDGLSHEDLDTLMLEAEHLNGDHGDTVLFVARYAGGHSDAREVLARRS